MKNHKSERWLMIFRLNCVFINDFNEWEDRLCRYECYLNCRLFAGFVNVMETTLDTPFRVSCE